MGGGPISVLPHRSLWKRTVTMVATSTGMALDYVVTIAWKLVQAMWSGLLQVSVLCKKQLNGSAPLRQWLTKRDQVPFSHLAPGSKAQPW
jgi:hypothetical protein